MKPYFETEAKAMLWWFLGFPLVAIVVAMLVLQVVGAPRATQERGQPQAGVAP